MASTLGGADGGKPGFCFRGYETIMTKAEIVQALYARVGGFSTRESADIVDLVFEMLKETLGKGEKIAGGLRGGSRFDEPFACLCHAENNA